MGRSLAIVIAVIFVDLLGFSIVLPLMPFYADRFQASDTLIGLLVASYAVAQFLATPFLGNMADRYGRRPILLISVFGSLIGFLIWGFTEPMAAHFPEHTREAALGLLLLSRVLDGFSGGNISVAQAYISDITSPEERSRGLGLVGAAFGLGFILGPPLGGWLSSGGDFALPAFVSATLAGLNWLAILFFLPESRPGGEVTKERSVFPLAAIRAALKRPRVGLLLWTSAIYFLAFSTFTSVFSLYTLRRFSLSADGNGILLGFVGIMIVWTQVGLVSPLTKTYGEAKVLRFGLPILAFSMLAWGLAWSLRSLMLVLVITPICAGSINVVLRSTLTKVVDPEEVGTMLGVQASVESLTRAIGPIWGALLMDHLSTGAPGVFCCLTLLALLVAVRGKLAALPDSTESSVTSDGGQGEAEDVAG